MAKASSDGAATNVDRPSHKHAAAAEPDDTTHHKVAAAEPGSTSPLHGNAETSTATAHATTTDAPPADDEAPVTGPMIQKVRAAYAAALAAGQKPTTSLTDEERIQLFLETHASRSKPNKDYQARAREAVFIEDEETGEPRRPEYASSTSSSGEEDEADR